MVLCKPSEELLEDYRLAVVESYQNDVDEWKPFKLENYDNWSKKIIGILKKVEEGKDLPDGVYKTNTYWCVDDDEFIGEVQIRSELTEEIAHRYGHISYAIRFSRWGKGYGTRLLKLALDKAAQLGFKEVIIVCHSANLGSIRVIEKNGGVFISRDERFDSNAYRLVLENVI